MPTTCGFPNCKFRSRYRGQEDNRHFYRIPKRPPILRQAWLGAIGRSEETVVSQLRICSAHFYGGEKREGDIPVADPQIDPPEFIELPPKEARSSERRARLKGHFGGVAASGGSSSTPTATARGPQLPSLIRPASAAAFARRRALAARQHHPPPMLFSPGATNHHNPLHNNRFAPLLGRGTPTNSARGGTTMSHPAQSPPHCAGSSEAEENSGGGDKPLTVATTTSATSFIFPQQQFAFASSAFLSSIFGMNKNFAHPTGLLARMTPPVGTGGGPFAAGTKPLVALLDGRDCSIEMPLLKDIATVAFCDAQSTGEIHEKVLNEASAALLYHSISLGREDLIKFKALKMVVRIGSGVHNIDLQAATELGIAICHTPAECVEESADSTMALILNMFRRTFWVARNVQIGKQPSSIEHLRDLMAGSVRVRGSTLGLIGMGRIGIAVALRAKAFGFRVLFYDPYIANGIERSLSIERCATLAEMLTHSDCISLHCPLQPDTRNIINVETIKSLKFGAFLVNTGEPELVQAGALLSALKTGHVRAAALDYAGGNTQQHQQQQQRSGEREILGKFYLGLKVLSSLPNVICTPQCAWYSEESSRELREAAAREVRRALTGSIPEDLKNCVNHNELMAMKQLIASGHTAASLAAPSSSSAPAPGVSPLLFAGQQHLVQRQRHPQQLPKDNNPTFGNIQLPISAAGLAGLCPVTAPPPSVSSPSSEHVVPPPFSVMDHHHQLNAYQQQLLMLQPQLLQQLIAQQQQHQQQQHNPELAGFGAVTTATQPSTTTLMTAHGGGGSGLETASGTPSMQDSVINHAQHHHHNQQQCSSSIVTDEAMDENRDGEKSRGEDGGRMEQGEASNNLEQYQQHYNNGNDNIREKAVEQPQQQQQNRHNSENTTPSFNFPNSPNSNSISTSICNGTAEIAGQDVKSEETNNQ